MQEILRSWLVAVVESDPVVSVGKEYRRPLVSALYVNKIDSQAAKWCTW